MLLIKDPQAHGFPGEVSTQTTQGPVSAVLPIRGAWRLPGKPERSTWSSSSWNTDHGGFKTGMKTIHSDSVFG